MLEQKVGEVLRSAVADSAGRSLVSANIASAALGLAFSVIAARTLGPDRFGSFSALLRAYLVFAAPFMAISAAIARIVALEEKKSAGSGQANAARLKGPALFISFAVGALATGLAFVSSRQLGVSPLTCLAFGAAVATGIHAATARGAAWGLQKYNLLAGSIAGEPLFRLLVGGFVALWAPTVGMFLCCYALGSLVSSGIADWRRPDHKNFSSAIRTLAKAVPSLAIAYALLQLLSQADIIAARLFLLPSDSGIYAAAATLTKAGLMVQGAVGTIVFRTALTERRPGGGLLRAVLTTGGVVSLGLVTCALAPAFILRSVFGESFVSGGRVLVLLALEMTLFAPAAVAVQYNLARAPWRTLLPLTASLIAVVVAFVLHHDSMIAIAQSLLIAPVALIVLLGVAMIFGFLDPFESIGGATAPPTA
jgi:O-antigen/teichoic acid export membrane protein